MRDLSELAHPPLNSTGTLMQSAFLALCKTFSNGSPYLMPDHSRMGLERMLFTRSCVVPVLKVMIMFTRFGRKPPV